MEGLREIVAEITKLREELEQTANKKPQTLEGMCEEIITSCQKLEKAAIRPYFPKP